jgi:integrase
MLERVPITLRSARRSSAVHAAATIRHTAARSGEARGMTWAELDLVARLWVVPGARMKAGREHRVPLSDQALKIIEKVAPLRDGDKYSPVIVGDDRCPTRRRRCCCAAWKRT